MISILENISHTVQQVLVKVAIESKRDITEEEQRQFIERMIEKG